MIHQTTSNNDVRGLINRFLSKLELSHIFTVFCISLRRILKGFQALNIEQECYVLKSKQILLSIRTRQSSSILSSLLRYVQTSLQFWHRLLINIHEGTDTNSHMAPFRQAQLLAHKPVFCILTSERGALHTISWPKLYFWLFNIFSHITNGNQSRWLGSLARQYLIQYILRAGDWWIESAS